MSPRNAVRQPVANATRITELEKRFNELTTRPRTSFDELRAARGRVERDCSVRGIRTAKIEVAGSLCSDPAAAGA